MNDIWNIFLEYLPDLLKVFFAIITAIITKKVVPVLTTAKNAKRLQEIIEFSKVLVDSAQRLDRAGKLAEITKKEYVMQELNGYITEKGYKFTEEQLDNIRRSAVFALEQTEQILVDTMNQIEEAAKTTEVVA